MVDRMRRTDSWGVQSLWGAPLAPIRVVVGPDGRIYAITAAIRGTDFSSGDSDPGEQIRHAHDWFLWVLNADGSLVQRLRLLHQPFDLTVDTAANVYLLDADPLTYDESGGYYSNFAQNFYLTKLLPGGAQAWRVALDSNHLPTSVTWNGTALYLVDAARTWNNGWVPTPNSARLQCRDTEEGATLETWTYPAQAGPFTALAHTNDGTLVVTSGAAQARISPTTGAIISTTTLDLSAVGLDEGTRATIIDGRLVAAITPDGDVEIIHRGDTRVYLRTRLGLSGAILLDVDYDGILYVVMGNGVTIRRWNTSLWTELPGYVAGGVVSEFCALPDGQYATVEGEAVKLYRNGALLATLDTTVPLPGGNTDRVVYGPNAHAWALVDGRYLTEYSTVGEPLTIHDLGSNGHLGLTYLPYRTEFFTTHPATGMVKRVTANGVIDEQWGGTVVSNPTTLTPPVLITPLTAAIFSGPTLYKFHVGGPTSGLPTTFPLPVEGADGLWVGDDGLYYLHVPANYAWLPYLTASGAATTNLLPATWERPGYISSGDGDFANGHAAGWSNPAASGIRYVLYNPEPNIGDYNNRVVRVNLDGSIALTFPYWTYSGLGIQSILPEALGHGVGGLMGATGVCVGSDGAVYVTESGHTRAGANFFWLPTQTEEQEWFASEMAYKYPEHTRVVAFTVMGQALYDFWAPIWPDDARWTLDPPNHWYADMGATTYFTGIAPLENGNLLVSATRTARDGYKFYGYFEYTNAGELVATYGRGVGVGDQWGQGHVVTFAGTTVTVRDIYGNKLRSWTVPAPISSAFFRPDGSICCTPTSASGTFYLYTVNGVALGTFTADLSRGDLDPARCVVTSDARIVSSDSVRGVRGHVTGNRVLTWQWGPWRTGIGTEIHDIAVVGAGPMEVEEVFVSVADRVHVFTRSGALRRIHYIGTYLGWVIHEQGNPEVHVTIDSYSTVRVRAWSSDPERILVSLYYHWYVNGYNGSSQLTLTDAQRATLAAEGLTFSAPLYVGAQITCTVTDDAGSSTTAQYASGNSVSRLRAPYTEEFPHLYATFGVSTGGDEAVYRTSPFMTREATALPAEYAVIVDDEAWSYTAPTTERKFFRGVLGGDVLQLATTIVPGILQVRAGEDVRYYESYRPAVSAASLRLSGTRDTLYVADRLHDRLLAFGLSTRALRWCRSAVLANSAAQTGRWIITVKGISDLAVDENDQTKIICDREHGLRYVYYSYPPYYSTYSATLTQFPFPAPTDIGAGWQIPQGDTNVRYLFATGNVVDRQNSRIIVDHELAPTYLELPLGVFSTADLSGVADACGHALGSVGYAHVYRDTSHYNSLPDSAVTLQRTAGGVEWILYAGAHGDPTGPADADGLLPASYLALDGDRQIVGLSRLHAKSYTISTTHPEMGEIVAWGAHVGAPAPGHHANLVDMVATPDRYLVTLDATDRRLQVFDENGIWQEELGRVEEWFPNFPLRMCVGPTGTIYVLDVTSTIHRIRLQGGGVYLGTTPAPIVEPWWWSYQPWNTSDFVVGGDGLIYCLSVESPADFIVTYRIVVIDTAGTVVRAFPVQYTEGARLEWLNDELYVGRYVYDPITGTLIATLGEEWDTSEGAVMLPSGAVVVLTRTQLPYEGVTVYGASPAYAGTRSAPLQRLGTIFTDVQRGTIAATAIARLGTTVIVGDEVTGALKAWDLSMAPSDLTRPRVLGVTGSNNTYALGWVRDLEALPSLADGTRILATLDPVNGWLVVRDQYGYHVGKFDLIDHVYAEFIGGGGNVTPRIRIPCALAAYGNGLYVLDDASHLHRFEYHHGVYQMADGGLHFAGYSAITLATTFAHPTDMTITPDGRLFVADTDNARLVELNLTTGAVVLDFPGPDGNAFSGPRALYADDELLYVRDGERVVELAINDYWSGPFADDALATPIRLAARADELLVLDATRVVRVDAVGNAQGAFGEALQPATFNPPTRITVAAGSYYVLDGENGRIISYTATGARQHVVDGLAIPSGLATNGTDRIAATSTAAHQVRLYDLDLNPVTFVGSLGSGNDQFNDPTGIAWTGTGWVVVDGGNARLIHLSAPGGYVSQHPISAGGREVARWTGHSVVLYSDHFTVYDDAGTVMSASGVDFYDARGLATDGVDLFVYADAVVLHYQWDAVTETWGVYNVFYPADEGTGLWVDATHIVIGEHTTDGAGRVVVADRDFIEELTWGVAGTDGRDLSAPVALAVDADEIAWVADSDEDLIKRYDLAENFLDPVALAGVVDLAASADGTTIYAVTVGGDLVTYVAATQAVTATVALGVTPTRMVVAGDGRLWIGAEGGTVGVYSAAGVLETSYSTTDTIIGAAPGDGVYTVSGTTLTRRSSTFALVITHALGAHAPVDSLHWGGAWWLTDTSSLTTLIPAWEAVRTWWKEGSPGTDPHQPFIEGVVAPVGTSAVAPDNLTMGLYDPTRDFLYSVAGPMRPTGIVAAQEDTGQYVPAVWVADASRCQVHAYSYRPTRPSTYLGAVQDPVFGHTLQAFDDEDGGVYTNTRERTDFPWTRSVRVIAEGAQGHPAIDSSGRYHVSVFDDDFVLRRFVSTDGGRTWAEEA